jgi:hypothetical protein
MATQTPNQQCDRCYPDIFDDELSPSAPKNLAQQRLYTAVRSLFGSEFGFAEVLPEKAKDFAVHAFSADEHRTYFMGVYGLLTLDGYKDPAAGGDHNAQAAGDLVVKDPDGKNVRIVPRFRNAFVRAVNEYVQNKALYTSIEPIVTKLSEYTSGSQQGRAEVRTEHLAAVGRKLADQGVPADNPQLALYTQEALSIYLGGRQEGSEASIEINLPSLDEDQSDNIVPENIIALSALYYCAMLEEMKLFQTADKVTELFTQGAIPLSRGPAGQDLYEYLRNAVNRFTEEERRGLYGRAFGLATGSVDVAAPNREFNDLWMRFLSAASWYDRQADKTAQHQQITVETLAKAANDVAVNLTLHGYGIGHFAAVELQRLVRDVLGMLGRQEIMSAFGATTVWQLVERVSEMYLGGAVNGVRHRTMAASGQKVIEWLGRHAKQLAPTLFETISQADRDDLYRHVERWLAVTGTQDAVVEKYSEPTATSRQPTIPSWSFSGMPSIDQVAGDLENLMPEGNA